jgi:hypothetical protein
LEFVLVSIGIDLVGCNPGIVISLVGLVVDGVSIPFVLTTGDLVGSIGGRSLVWICSFLFCRRVVISLLCVLISLGFFWESKGMPFDLILGLKVVCRRLYDWLELQLICEG